MLAETIQKTEKVWKTVQEPEYSTYIPSLLLLVMATENGWDILKAELKPSYEQYGFVYLVTLKCQSNGQCQELVIPKSGLVEQILDQHTSASILLSKG